MFNLQVNAARVWPTGLTRTPQPVRAWWSITRPPIRGIIGHTSFPVSIPNVPVLQSGATTSFAATTSLTTTQYNTLIISFYSVNNGTAVNALTPNCPLFQRSEEHTS